MANLGAIENELNGVPAEFRVRLLNAFREVLKMRFGRPPAEGRSKAENLPGALVAGRTAATAGEEFSIEHGLNSAPYLWIPLGAFVTNVQSVQLTVSRAPDNRRCYFTSTDEDAPFAVYVEA